MIERPENATKAQSCFDIIFAKFSGRLEQVSVDVMAQKAQPTPKDWDQQSKGIAACTAFGRSFEPI